MKSSVVLVLVLALSAAHVQASVQKVLGLLKEMKSQGEDALEKEEILGGRLNRPFMISLYYTRTFQQVVLEA